MVVYLEYYKMVKKFINILLVMDLIIIILFYHFLVYIIYKKHVNITKQYDIVFTILLYKMIKQNFI